MEPKKLRKLVLKKETISVLNDYSQSKIKGGGACPTRLITGYVSHQEVGDCVYHHANSDQTFCICESDTHPAISDCCGTGPCTTNPCGNSAVYYPISYGWC